MLKPTHAYPRVLAQQPAPAAWVGVPELVTDCRSDGLRGPIASDEALPSGPLGPSESRNILCIDMSHVRTESDLGKLEISSMLCIH